MALILPSEHRAELSSMKTEQISAAAVRSRRLAQERSAALEHHAARPGHVDLLVTRVFDAIVAIALLGLLAVPMLLIGLLVKLTSRGPALYRQERAGLNGAPFIMYKFRTMRLDAEADTGPVWAVSGDPRCTRFGSWLRRFSLDELPQLINVALGDMSLVGPRPERPFFVARFAKSIPRYNHRHVVRPGITGWAQVKGWRGDSSIEHRTEFDLYYVDHWSLGLNLRILLLTPFRVLIEQNG
jgi:putative colanic acid biosysnthesis UDP-glucose lipid carrier transferase